jgi:polysaccharide export outer membrane protein
MSKFRLFASVIGFALLLAALVPVTRANETAIAPGSRHSTLLGFGDTITIQIYGQPESASIYVGDDGTIAVPLAGPVQVAGMSAVEAANKVAKILKDKGYFVNPQVSILVTQSGSQLVTVTGEVARPGRFPVTPQTTLLDLLAQAGGVAQTASDLGYVVRQDSTGHSNRYPINLNGLTDLKDALPTPTLQGGDLLLVPKADQAYIYGEVSKPGEYKVEAGMTVMQLIARAGGVTERGSERRIQVKRTGKNGKYDVSSLKPGDLVQPKDIIRVKESIF